MSPPAYGGRNESAQRSQSLPAQRRYYAARTAQRAIPTWFNSRYTFSGTTKGLR
jgi:hypothetical protein